jgi:chorismate dehydratase
MEPDYLTHRPNLDEMLKRSDAALLIGDAALELPGSNHDVWDLGEAWQKWQDRPFVFAFWACRPDGNLGKDTVEVFLAAKTWGLERRPEIARTYSRKLNLPESAILEYLSINIDYGLEASHLDGLRRFYRLAHEEGYVEALRAMRFL